jgi:hypothetical protein
MRGILCNWIPVFTGMTSERNLWQEVSRQAQVDARIKSGHDEGGGKPPHPPKKSPFALNLFARHRD